MEPSEYMEDRVEELERRLRTQADLYRTLLDLAKKQVQDLSPEGFDAFILLLEEKREIIDTIGEVETEIRPLRDYWESHKQEAAEKDRMRLRAVVDDVRTILLELLEVESKSQKKLGNTMDIVEEHIRQLSIGPDAVRSYVKNGEDKPRFMDEMG